LYVVNSHQGGTLEVENVPLKIYSVQGLFLGPALIVSGARFCDGFNHEEKIFVATAKRFVNIYTQQTRIVVVSISTVTTTI